MAGMAKSVQWCDSASVAATLVNSMHGMSTLKDTCEARCKHNMRQHSPSVLQVLSSTCQTCMASSMLR